jgi:hypothetical protein
VVFHRDLGGAIRTNRYLPICGWLQVCRRTNVDHLIGSGLKLVKARQSIVTTVVAVTGACNFPRPLFEGETGSRERITSPVHGRYDERPHGTVLFIS